MVREPEIAHRAGGDLADAERRAVLLPFELDELAILGDFAAPEDGPRTVLDRPFDGKSVVVEPLAVVVLDRLTAPGEGAGELPPGSDLAGVERARRPAGLVDPRLELLRVDEPAPASLQRQFGGRVP